MIANTNIYASSKTYKIKVIKLRKQLLKYKRKKDRLRKPLEFYSRKDLQEITN